MPDQVAPRQVFYAASVHDEAEIQAVVDVLRDPRGLWVGKRVNAMERAIAALFGKDSGVMVNSGSSALYLAIELLGAQPGDEVIGSAVTFSTDVAPIVRAGLVPVFVDVEPDTYVVNVDQIEDMISDRTRALLIPNLIGNVPDWDAIRAIADRRGLAVIEDSCDALGATVRGTPSGTRADFSVTSFASSHIITCGGGGGMLLTNEEAHRDRALLLRRWGRRSELHFFGSKRRDRNFWEDLDGINYDNQFIFDELAWNFEPSEMGAAFGLEQLKKLPDNHRRRQRNFDLYTEFFRQHEDRFVVPRQLPEVDTAWLCYPLTIRPHAGFDRPAMQQFLDGAGVETRTVWTGNATRQPMLADVRYRSPAEGLPVSDRIMEAGIVLPSNHGMTDDDISFVTSQVTAFLGSEG